MKVYISQRMAGLTRDEILAERELGKAAVRVYYPDAEFIDSYFEDYDASGDKKPMDYFADTVKMMSQANLCAFLPGFYGCRGAEVEDHIAIAYGIPRFYITLSSVDNGEEFVNHETEELIGG